MQIVQKFELLLTTEQQQTLDRWTEVCRRVWNIGRSLLLEWEDRTCLAKEPIGWVSRFDRAYDPSAKIKQKTIAVPCSPLAIKGEGLPPDINPVRTSKFLNKIPLNENQVVVLSPDDKEKIVELKSGQRELQVWGEHCWIIPKDRVGGTVNKWTGQSTHVIEPDLIRVGQFCPAPIPEWREPRLGLEVIGKYTLQYYFTQTNIKKLYPEFAPDFCELPVWFIRGVCKDLTEAWAKYRSRQGGVPRFKRVDDVTESLSHHDGKAFGIKPIEIKNNELVDIPGAGILNEGDGLINIPKFGEVAALEIWKRWGKNPIAVVQLVKTVEKEQTIWKLHLTGYEIHPADIYNVVRLVAVQRCQMTAPVEEWILTPAALLELLTASPWALKRNAVTNLSIPGSGYVVAVDDRGVEYSVLPHRASDGVVDPHGKIAALDKKILDLQQTISRQERRHAQRRDNRQEGEVIEGESNRLKRNRRELKTLKRERTQILSRNRKKLAHFLSERSAQINIEQREVKRVRKPKRKLKPKTIDPAVFERNNATLVAEENRVKADVAPGEFIALLKSEAKQRAQPIRVVKVESL